MCYEPPEVCEGIKELWDEEKMNKYEIPVYDWDKFYSNPKEDKKQEEENYVRNSSRFYRP